MDIVLKKSGNDIDSYKNADGIIIPATVDTDMIITSDRSVVKFPSPTTIYAAMKKETIGKDNYINECNIGVIKEIQTNYIESLTKQVIISAFNAVISNSSLVEHCDSCIEFNKTCANNQTLQDQFYTKETLDDLLKLVSLNINNFNQIFNVIIDYNYSNDGLGRYNLDIMLDFAFNIIGKLYNIALNHTVTDVDAFYLNRFNMALVEMLPTAYAKYAIMQKYFFEDMYKIHKVKNKNSRYDDDDECYF